MGGVTSTIPTSHGAAGFLTPTSLSHSPGTKPVYNREELNATNLEKIEKRDGLNGTKFQYSIVYSGRLEQFEQSWEKPLSCCDRHMFIYMLCFILVPLSMAIAKNSGVLIAESAFFYVWLGFYIFYYFMEVCVKARVSTLDHYIVVLIDMDGKTYGFEFGRNKDKEPEKNYKCCEQVGMLNYMQPKVLEHRYDSERLKKFKPLFFSMKSQEAVEYECFKEQVLMKYMEQPYSVFGKTCQNFASDALKLFDGTYEAIPADEKGVSGLCLPFMQLLGCWKRNNGLKEWFMVPYRAPVPDACKCVCFNMVAVYVVYRFCVYMAGIIAATLACDRSMKCETQGRFDLTTDSNIVYAFCIHAFIEPLIRAYRGWDYCKAWALNHNAFNIAELFPQEAQLAYLFGCYKSSFKVKARSAAGDVEEDRSIAYTVEQQEKYYCCGMSCQRCPLIFSFTCHYIGIALVMLIWLNIVLAPITIPLAILENLGVVAAYVVFGIGVFILALLLSCKFGQVGNRIVWRSKDYEEITLDDLAQTTITQMNTVGRSAVPSVELGTNTGTDV